MGVLLLLVGLLGLASGGLKLRARVRRTTGYSRLTLLEVALGAAVFLGSGLGLSRMRPLAWLLVFATLAVTLVSTWLHAKRVRLLVEKRRQSEALRLQTFIHAGKTHDAELSDRNSH